MAASKRTTSVKESIAALGIGAVLLIAGFWLSYQFVEPAPPTSISISTGSEEGAYYSYALQYKELLAEQGITLNIATSAGSSENLERLLTDKTDLAFVQGGLTQANTPLQSLGSLYTTSPYGFSIKQINLLAS